MATFSNSFITVAIAGLPETDADDDMGMGIEVLELKEPYIFQNSNQITGEDDLLATGGFPNPNLPALKLCRH